MIPDTESWASARILSILPPDAGLQDPYRLRPLLLEALAEAVEHGREEWRRLVEDRNDLLCRMQDALGIRITDGMDGDPVAYCAWIRQRVEKLTLLLADAQATKAHLQRQVEGLCSRVAAQSELLSRKAKKAEVAP